MIRDEGEGARIDWAEYDDLSYEAFRRRALDPSLSASEKIGFPDALREGSEERILDSITASVGLDRAESLVVADIGCGCGDLAKRLIEFAAVRNHRLMLVDSAEMLSQLPDADHVRKIPGRFPDPTLPLADLVRSVDAVVVYSVLQYVFAEAGVFEFVDAALELLAPGGALLLGDVPNVSKRRRFFASEHGRAFHRAFMAVEDAPDVASSGIERRRIDDAVVLALVARARAAGFDAYVLPQPDDLPFANRREDLVVKRP
jgi:SAM-dependent methyltransferase